MMLMMMMIIIIVVLLLLFLLLLLFKELVYLSLLAQSEKIWACYVSWSSKGNPPKKRWGGPKKGGGSRVRIDIIHGLEQ